MTDDVFATGLAHRWAEHRFNLPEGSVKRITTDRTRGVYTDVTWDPSYDELIVQLAYPVERIADDANKTPYTTTAIVLEVDLPGVVAEMRSMAEPAETST